MSKKPGPGRPFPKGVSGNPSGKPKIAQHLAHIKTLQKDELMKIISLHFCSGRETLEGVVEKAAWAIDGVIASAILLAWRTGDLNKVVPLLDRLFGKIPTELPDTGAIQKLTIERISGEKVELTSQVGEAE